MVAEFAAFPAIADAANLDQEFGARRGRASLDLEQRVGRGAGSAGRFFGGRDVLLHLVDHRAVARTLPRIEQPEAEPVPDRFVEANDFPPDLDFHPLGRVLAGIGVVGVAGMDGDAQHLVHAGEPCRPQIRFQRLADPPIAHRQLVVRVAQRDPAGVVLRRRDIRHPAEHHQDGNSQFESPAALPLRRSHHQSPFPPSTPAPTLTESRQRGKKHNANDRRRAATTPTKSSRTGRSCRRAGRSRRSARSASTATTTSTSSTAASTR